MSSTQPHLCSVLVVDDNDGDIYLLRQALQSAGLNCEIRVFFDGASAAVFLANAPPEKLPELAMVDYNLPRNGGARVLEAIRGNQHLASIPVVVSFSSAARQDKRSLEPWGVDRYVVKGPDLEAFLQVGAVIKELLGEHRLAKQL